MSERIQQHYFRDNLFEQIVDAIGKRGVSNITRQDLAPFDEFHVRGAAVSLELAKDAELFEHCKVLDVGCGLGGPARMLAAEFRCVVTGIDITEEFVRTAGLLSELLQLQDKTKFLKADALALPFPDFYFDAVWTQHVQMNIADKQQFYSEIKRVLAPGGKFIYYDIFSEGDVPPDFPLPWADDASISQLLTINTFKTMMSDLGFKKISSKDQTAAAIEFFKSITSRRSAPSSAMQLILGDDAMQKTSNLQAGLQLRKLALQSGVYLNWG